MKNLSANPDPKFDFLKSKIKELHIPLPKFKKFFHKPSSEEEGFDNFVGREEEAEKLEAYLSDGDSGSYLITGYRGAGKTSFVGEVLHKITSNRKKPKVRLFNISCMLLVFSIIGIIFILLLTDIRLLCTESKILNIIFLSFLSIAFLGFIAIHVFDRVRNCWYKHKRECEAIDEVDYKNHKAWFAKVFGIRDIKESKHNLVIKINLGHENLKEKDILSLIANRIFDKYKEYQECFYTNWLKIIFRTIFLFCFTIFIVFFLDSIDVTSFLHKPHVNDSSIYSSALLNNTNAFNGVLHESSITSNNSNELHNSGVISNSNSTLHNSSNLYITFYNFVIKGIINGKSFFEIKWLSFVKPLLITKIILVIIFYFLSKRLWSFFANRIPFIRKYSKADILHKLKFLIDRIEASVTVGSGQSSGYTHSSSIFSINFSPKKNKTYPIASVREIEDELIQILEKIHNRFLKKLFKPPKFIIIFDELDKIDPIYNNAIKAEQNIPEFEGTTTFQGGSATRNRKQNVLRLLGNMKLFMSQAKVKFVFIAGRELYDAFLADLADREFAASSIFNEVIYVDSFLESSTKQKNIITRTEEYICGYLIPKKWYKEEAKVQYYKEKGIENPQKFQKKAEILLQKLGNSTYREPNLRMYRKFLIETLIIDDLEKKRVYIKDKKIENFKEFKSLNKILSKEEKNDFLKIARDYMDSPMLMANKIKILFEDSKLLSKEETEKLIEEVKTLNFVPELIEIKDCKVKKIVDKYFSSNNSLTKKERMYLLSEIEHTFSYIDKIIVFLNQFSIYLTHVCNGSPKKITLYFEKYINQFISLHPKNPFSKSENEDIRGSKYCLSFKVQEQQKIGFIYYLTYPITQAIINNASHFGDKMLVSTSFLIDHIFKHHKGGFSHENIEHTPELLEVYHIPHLRTVIDNILSFLKQNFITDICGGIYQYKFRKFITDEILYNARISEEISAIFNFTLDESLPVKRYYYKQIAENEKKYLALEERIHNTPDNPKNIVKNQYTITLASQLETLGEIHLWDEEYNEAIQYYQSSFEIIKTELKRTRTDKSKLQLYVLFIRTSLKLGLAKERRGYYDEAFVIYNMLLDYLFEFRNLKEESLGLNYFFEDNDLVKDETGEWKTKKAKLYHNMRGNILKDFYSYRRPDNDGQYLKNITNWEYLKSRESKGDEIQGLFKDSFYNKEVFPFYKKMGVIQNENIDYLITSDYIVSGLSKMLSAEKQEIISRLTFFSEIKPVYQVILANLFIVEKIDLNGITQDNLDLAEDQFEYIYLLTDSKDKFIQAADFYKKLASILFLKNYSDSKKYRYLQMWGFDIIEAINEFCFIYSDEKKEHQKMFAGKFPKEILFEFFINNLSNEDNVLWDIFLRKETDDEIIKNLLEIYFSQYEAYDKNRFLRKRKVTDTEKKVITTIIYRFYRFGIEKRDQYLIEDDLKRCAQCYDYCSDREMNHPCYACNYVSRSLEIFRRVLVAKARENLNTILEKRYLKRKSYFFKLLEYYKKTDAHCNNNYFFVLGSALRIKADILLSCVNGENDNKLNSSFLKELFVFLTGYYNNEPTYDNFIDQIDNEKTQLSKLEKAILYYWLSAEYFHLSTSDVDANECLTKILIIFDKYLNISKELHLLDNVNKIHDPFEEYNKNHDDDIFEKIQNTIVRRVLKNSRTTADNVNYIELQNLKQILRYKGIMNINLSYLSTTPSIVEVLFSYCKFELNSIAIEKYLENKNCPIYLDCYKSTTLLSSNRFSLTFQEKIHAFEFKERMNMTIFENIFKQLRDDYKQDADILKIPQEINFYNYDFPVTYFWFLKHYFENYDITKITKLLNLPEIYESNVGAKIKLLHFFIDDSLYCLTQIVEALTSGEFSHFSHSFIGDIYHKISKWATLYQYTFAVLRKYSPKHQVDDDIKVFKQKACNTMWKRRIALENILDTKEARTEFDNLPKIKDFIDDDNGTVDKVSNILKSEVVKISDRSFETDILNDIGTGSRHFLLPNYSIAMALKYYHCAIRVNRDGKEYKEMVKKMYITGDDITNGMHNFSLALERYAMNCGVIKEKMNMLRKYYKHSLSHPLKNYVKEVE